jgi:hypothetical protein
VSKRGRDYFRPLFFENLLHAGLFYSGGCNLKLLLVNLKKMAEERKRMKPLQMAFLLLMLVVLPAGSWFYLRGGYQHRKAALEELKEAEAVGDFSLADQNGLVFATQDLKKRVTIAGFLPTDPERQGAWMDGLIRMHEQFDDRNDVCFLLFADTTSISSTQDFVQSYNLSDSLQWILLQGNADSLHELATGSFHLPAGAETQQLALIDTSGMVRRHYDAYDNRQLGRLVEHITILMPRLPDPDIVFKREKEK